MIRARITAITLLITTIIIRSSIPPIRLSRNLSKIMRKRNKFVVFIAILALFSFKSSCFALDPFLSDFLVKFLDNPGDFFFNLHAANEDYNPVPADAHGAIRFNFFPTFLPTSWMNLTAKAKIFNDRGNMPQVDLVGSYGDLLALKFLDQSSADVKPVFNDYSFGIVLSKGFNDKTKIFGGFKYSTINMNVKFSSPVVVSDFSINALDFKVADTFFFTGLTHQTSQFDGVSAEIGYGFTYKKIVSRIMVNHRHLELGMDIFPEGLIVVQPFLAWHWVF
jgi:hypothetical protein